MYQQFHMYTNYTLKHINWMQTSINNNEQHEPNYSTTIQYFPCECV